MPARIHIRLAAAVALLALGGCARSLVITNATGQPVEVRRTAGDGESEITLGPGGRISIPLGDEVNVNGMLIEVR